MQIDADASEVELPTGNPFLRSAGTKLEQAKEFVATSVVPRAKSAGTSLKRAVQERDLSKVKAFAAKVVYFARRAAFATLTILSDVSSGSADFFASLATKVNPGEHIPQLADRFSSRPGHPEPVALEENEEDEDDAPPTIND